LNYGLERRHSVSSIGIVLPVYNGAEYIEETLDSIMKSTRTPDEIIIVDDGSTDGSAEIACNKLQAYTLKWQVISQINSGEATAVNVGVRGLQSDYLLIVNADDPIEPELILETTTALDLNADKVVAYPDWNMIDKRGRKTRTVITANYSRDLLYGSFVCIPGPGALIRLSAVVGDLRNPKFSHVADYGTWLKLGKEGDFIRIPKPLANWRNHSEGQTSQGKGRLLAEQYVNLMTAFFDGEPPESALMTYRHSGIASAYYHAAIQGLFMPGVRPKALVAKAFNHILKAKQPIARWPFRPIIVAALFLAPFSRWILTLYSWGKLVTKV
jgi:hypothetical protein